MDSLSGTVLIQSTWQAANNINSSATGYGQITNSSTISSSESLGTAAANNALDGADQLISYIISVAASGNTTADITALTNVLGQSATLARIKSFMFRLLNATLDPVTCLSNATNSTQITIGNAATNAQNLGLSTNATKDIFTGGTWAEVDQRASGYTVNTTLKNIKIVNQDATNTAKIQLTIWGGTN